MARITWQPKAIAIVTAWSLLVTVTWGQSTLAGWPGRETELRAVLSRHLHTTGECQATLTDWAVSTAREGVAFEFPTAAGFRSEAKSLLTRYAASSCPKGALLVAGRIVSGYVTEARAAAGLVRTGLAIRPW